MRNTRLSEQGLLDPAEEAYRQELLAQERAEEAAKQHLDLFDVLLIFARRKWLILGFTVAGILCGWFLLLRQITLYRADATIMVPQQSQSSSALIGQLGALAGIASESTHGPGDLYMGLLQSRDVNQDMVRRFGLRQVYGVPETKDAANLLLSRARFNVEKSGLMQISVEDHDPKRSAVLANGYIDELYRLNSQLAIGEAGQRRQFFEEQLAEARDKLGDAEIKLKEVELQTGVLELSSQTQGVIRAEADIRANITTHEVQLASLSASATNENPDVIRLRTELGGLRAQLAQLQKGQVNSGAPASAAQIPEAAIAYEHAARDVKYYQTLYDLLARQLEAARLDEAKASPTIQVIDRAQVPERRSWPSKGLFLAVGALIGFVLGCVRTAVLYLYDLADEDPRFRDKFRALKRSLRSRA